MSHNARKKERRQQILEAALTCFSRNGYDNTTMDDIAAEAGVSKGTLYNYFADKKQLFLAILGMFSEPFEAYFEEVVAADDTAENKLRAIVAAMAEWGEASNIEELSLLTLDFYSQMRFDEEVNARLTDYLNRYLAYMAQIIQQGIDQGEFKVVDPRQTAIGITAVLDGMGIYQMMALNNFDMPHDAAAFLETILAGLRRIAPDDG